MSNTTEPDIVENYLLDINMPRDSSVPLEVYIAFPKTLTDPQAKETIRKEWVHGNDKQVVAMNLLSSDGLTAIFRPTGLMIDWKNYIVSVYTPSGLSIIIPPDHLRTLGTTTEEQISNLNDYLYIKFRKNEGALVSTMVIPLRGSVETTIAKELLEKSIYHPVELLMIGLGYRPEKPVIRLFLPRLISWFKGFDGKPMHICQFTLPESAKTNFGIRNETLFNWKYIPEPPTLARLILDARQGILGEVFLRNGIVFDEFDKWSIDTADRRYTFDSILTGMEQGKWERGVSALGVRTPDVPRLIPLIFFGNLGDFAKLYGVMKLITRAWFVQIFTARLSHDVSALADRLCIIDACFEKVPIMDYLTYKVLPDSVIRGIISEIQKQVVPYNISKLRGRLGRHSNNVYSILKALQMPITPEISDEMVAGTYEWDKTMQLPLPVEPVIPKRDETPQPDAVDKMFSKETK